MKIPSRKAKRYKLFIKRQRKCRKRFLVNTNGANGLYTIWQELGFAVFFNLAYMQLGVAVVVDTN